MHLVGSRVSRGRGILAVDRSVWIQSSAGTPEAPLYSLYLQRPSSTLWSDASGDAPGG